jgi:citrate lyase subunit alpha / citrate CoA-transferase
MSASVLPTVCRDWDTLFAAVNMRSGMRISFHHHLRYGDLVTGEVLRELDKRGIRDLTLCVSSIMGSACEAAAAAVRSGTVSAIETTGLKDPLAQMVRGGELDNPVIFRTHGGRARAVRTGEAPIDVAFIAASAVDHAGNMNGTDGPSRFGSLGYAHVDAAYARTVVAVTDNLCSEPLEYISISGERIACIMTVDRIGDNTLISSGSLRTSANPIQRLVAERTRDLLLTLGALKNGMGFQAGSGAVSLQVTRLATEVMRERGIRGSFASGGITSELTGLLEQGLFETLYDVQSFDLTAAESLRRNAGHREMSAARYADPGIAGNIAGQLDLMILSAAEVDCSFNLNSLTGTNGRIIGALGGAPDTAAGSSLTVAVLPSIRGRIPTVHMRVQTICTPGSRVDAVVTERGIAVNPLREDLTELLARSRNLDIVTIGELLRRVHAVTGTPEYPRRTGRTAAVVEDREGSLLDTISVID